MDLFILYLYLTLTSKALLAAKRQQVNDARALMAATAANPTILPDNETECDDDEPSSMRAYQDMSENEHMMSNMRLHVERERVTMADKNKLIKEQLQVFFLKPTFGCWLKKALAAALEATRDDAKTTVVDRQHQENILLGRDKFKTLRAIKSGNTKSRVAAFEDL